jgi:hypothetical protein
MLLAVLVALAVSFGFVPKVLAAVGDPDPVCVDKTCTLNFEFTGEPYEWVPPAGAQKLRFELFGGQGGQGVRTMGQGGYGGRIAGEFLELPSKLMIFVGGAGVRESGADGGYNGGGAAGVGQGDEGSGGGATDLRTSLSLEDRIVVAGGGGGAGARNWDGGGLGGSGGALVGRPGSWGQAGPGTGGSQISGGQGGVSVGGPSGLPGNFGLGGNGSSSRFAGGGGGGGGYFGGGGGGSDIDSGGLNGGGGGGGSSYAASSRFKDVEHNSGVHQGHGRAVLTYELDVLQPQLSADTSADTSGDTSDDTSTDESVDGSVDVAVETPAAPTTPQPSAPAPEARPEPAVDRQPEHVPQPEPVAQPEPEPMMQLQPEPNPAEIGLAEEVTLVELIDQQPRVVLRPRPPAGLKVPLEVELGSQTQQVLAPMPFRQSESAEQPESFATLPLRPGFDLVPWVNGISGISLLTGVIQAIRRLRQNHRTSARRFVRIN